MKNNLIALFFIFSYCFSEAKNDTTWVEIPDIKTAYSVDLIQNSRSHNFFLVGGGNKISFIDSNLNVSYVTKAKNISNTTKLLLDDKLFFIKYLYSSNKGLFGLYITNIATKTKILDTMITIMEKSSNIERKLVDKRTNQIRMAALSSPDNSSILIYYENNYKKSIKEGFVFKIIKGEAEISKEVVVTMDYLDVNTKLGKFYYDGNNIFITVEHYEEKHRRYSTPSSYKLLRYNISSKKISSVTFSSNIKRSIIRTVDLCIYKNDIFLLNASVKETGWVYEFEELKLTRYNENLVLEDSLMVGNKILDELSFQNDLTMMNIDKWQIGKKLLPKIENSFPTYFINYKYKTHTPTPRTVGGLLISSAAGIPMIGGMKTNFVSTSNLVLSSNGNTHVFNDTLIRANYGLLPYSLKSEHGKLLLRKNVFNKEFKLSGFEEYDIKRREWNTNLTGIFYYYQEERYDEFTKKTTIPIIKNNKIYLIQY